MQTKQVIAISFISALLVAGIAQADDLYPADYRGLPLSVEAHWEFNPPFSFNSGNTLCDAWNAANDPRIFLDMVPSIAWSSENDWQYSDELSAVKAVSDNAGFIISLPNFIDDEPLKQLRIQIAYLGVIPMIEGGRGYKGDSLIPMTFVQRYEQSGYFYEDWKMKPNPDWEEIFVSVPLNTYIYEVDIDTISIPEPATLGLLVLGGLTILRRRRNLAQDGGNRNRTI